MTTQIAIDSTRLASVVLANKDKIGSTDWDVYVDENGAIECRHDTWNNRGWVEIVDLCHFWTDEDTQSSAADELGEFLKSEGVDLDAVEEVANLDRYDEPDFELSWA